MGDNTCRSEYLLRWIQKFLKRGVPETEMVFPLYKPSSEKGVSSSKFSIFNFFYKIIQQKGVPTPGTPSPLFLQ